MLRLRAPLQTSAPARTASRAAAQAGFTLIELLVVIAIIALIGAAATPQLMKIMERGRVSGTAQNMDAIDKALKMYSFQHDGAYPQVGDPGALVPAKGALEAHLAEQLETMNLEDGWGNSIYYGSDGINFTLRSYGKNKVVDAATGTITDGDFNADIIIVNGGKVQWPR
jgi:general secretion pathway protein G